MFVIVFEFDVDCNVVRLTAKLHTEGDEPPQSFLSFTVVNYNSVYQVETFWHCSQQMFRNHCTVFRIRNLTEIT